MAKEICISSTPHETRLAILEDDQLSEIYYERENEYTLAGSIYKGRVTRVLPGMQSAFVDIGLERDAFLYITDFLEEQEDGDELETSPAPAPRQSTGRAPQQPRQESRPERQPRLQPIEVSTATEQTVAATPTEGGSEAGEENGDGARRWRGRRGRRRGIRSAQAAPSTTETGTPAQPEETLRVSESADNFVFEGGYDVPDEAEEVKERFIQQVTEEAEQDAPVSRRFSREAREESRSATPPLEQILLPGESLARFGGQPAAETDKPATSVETQASVSTPRITSKPSTLIETPIVWDGKGLLPGESISRHRNREEAESEPVASSPVNAEPIGILADATFAEKIVSEELIEEELIEEFESEEQEVVDDSNLAEDEVVVEESAITETASEPTQAETGDLFEAHHNVDPNAPSEFRFKDLFGGKKKDEKKPARKVIRSNYQPGTGHLEEEIVDDDEVDIHHPAHSLADDGDSDDLEEQTTERQGEIGEMFQEAHLDHKIQRAFGAGGEEDEEAVAAPRTAATSDRAGRGRGRNDRSRGTERSGERSSADRGSRGGNRNGGMSRRTAQTTNLPAISDLLKAGQEVLVQIAKEPIAKKGARITSHIALPGRFLVFMPTVNHVGVSRKIESDEERHRLKRILIHEKGEASGGFIVRTAADGASEDELRSDLRFLINLWNDIKQRSDASKAPALIYHDLNLVERILRDQVSDNFSTIWVDTEADYERIVRFLNRFSPELVRRVKLWTKELPMFEEFGIQEDISKALQSKVWLKSGGSIVINQTEALVAIDINTGKYVGKTARLEDTILKTNLDAIPEIVRQIRLRDLGGIIIIDFIDMDERKNRNKVMAALEEAMKVDRAPSKVLQFNDFGLVAITRKRVKQSLERTLSVPCGVCTGTGMVKSPATVCNEIYVELRKMHKGFTGADVMLRVHPEVVKALKGNNARWLYDMEEIAGKNIVVKSDATLHPEQFDIQ
jgi:ribonuclease G